MRNKYPDQEATMPEPLVMTLAEALALAVEEQWHVSFEPNGTVAIHDKRSYELAYEDSWEAAFSTATYRPVVERDDKAELVKEVGILLDNVQPAGRSIEGEGEVLVITLTEKVHFHLVSMLAKAKGGTA